jgi:hypothetical protein
MRLLVCSETEGELQLGLSVDIASDWPGVIVQLGVQNAAAQSQTLKSLDVLAWSHATGELRLPGPPRSQHAAVLGTQASARPLFWPIGRRGSLQAEQVASLRAPGHAGLTVGFLGAQRMRGLLELETRDEELASLRARHALTNQTLEPDERILSERLWVSIDTAGADGLAAWAERAAHEAGVALRPPVGVWALGPHDDPTRLAPEVVRCAPAAEVLRIDGQLAAATLPDDALGAGARAARDAGLAPGLRLPLPADLTGARGYMRTLGERLRELGFLHVWLDGLAGAHAPEAYVGALTALREGAGPELRVAGRDASFALSMGYLDALERSPGDADDDARSRHWWQLRRRSVGEAAPADWTLYACLAGRAFRVTVGELDLDRADDATLREGAALAAILGGDVILRGDPAQLPPARQRLARRLLPPLALAPLRAGGRRALYARCRDGAVLVHTSELLPLGRVGAPPAVRGFDALGGRLLGRVEGVLEVDPAAPASLVRLVPIDDAVRIVGSTLHITAGAAEVSGIVTRGERARIDLTLRGPHEGALLLAMPGTEALSRLRVKFVDALSVEAGAAEPPFGRAIARGPRSF